MSKTHSDLRTSPSGRGAAVTHHVADKYQQHYPVTPIPFGISGASGMPSSEFSVGASRLMQQTMTDEDFDYYSTIHAKPPYDINRFQSAKGMSTLPIDTNDVGGMVIDNDDIDGNEDLLRAYIQEVLMIDDDDRDEDLKDEASVSANVAGYTLPLGAGNIKRKRSKSYFAKTFGGS